MPTLIIQPPFAELAPTDFKLNIYDPSKRQHPRFFDLEIYWMSSAFKFRRYGPMNSLINNTYIISTIYPRMTRHYKCDFVY